MNLSTKIIDDPKSYFYVAPEAQLDDIPDIYKENENQPLLLYIRRPKVNCNNGILVALIKSARYDFEQRRWIRNYYAKMKKKEDFSYDLFFLLGSGETLREELTAEGEEHDDLIIGDFVDNYENLPLKTFLGFQFFAEFCYPQKKIVIFHDSDAFVLVPDILKDYRAQWKQAEATEPWARPAYLTDVSVYCIKGQTIPTKADFNSFPMGIAKTYTSKWFNWYSDWQPKYAIPRYCNGNCKSLTGEAAYKIWTEAQRTNRRTMRIEDKFYLGVLRKKAGIPDNRVVPVTSVVSPGNDEFNGFSRCVHISDATYYINATMGPKNPAGEFTVLSGKKANSSELMEFVADLYLSGKWMTPPKGFIYGHGYGNHILAKT